MIQAQTICSIFDRPLLAEFDGGAGPFAGDGEGCAVWGGRDTVVRPREVGWRAGGPVSNREY